MNGIRLAWGVPLVVIAALFAAVGCQPGTEEHRADVMPALSVVRLKEGDRLKAMATTSIVGDVARQVGGDLIDLQVLLPLGADPHAFDPTPRDAAALADAHVVFINGAGLEAFMGKLLESTGKKVSVVPVSFGIELLKLAEEHDHEVGDPHTWFDPNNVVVWVNNVEYALSALDPQHAEAYKANADAYRAKLRDLDAWIRAQVAQVPEANRKLVTDHETLGYFARRYGFEQVGAVIPGYSTLSAPSAQDLADLQEAIRKLEVKAVFVGKATNPDLARRVADDTGTKLVFVYHGSLSEPGGPAGDYLSLMRYNVEAIVDALK